MQDGGIFYLTNASGSWTHERLTTPPTDGAEPGRDADPAIAIDVDGSLWIAFTRYPADPIACCPVDYAGPPPAGISYVHNPGSGWSEPAEIAGAGSNGPALVVRDGVIHLAYRIGGTGFAEEEDDNPIRYATDAGGSLTDVLVAERGSLPCLALAAEGAAHVAFDELRGDQSRLWYAVGSATAAFAVDLIPGSGDLNVGPLLAIGGDGGRHVYWSDWDGQAARYSQYAGGTWSAPIGAPSSASASALALDDSGRVHLLAVNSALLYGSDATGSFAFEPVAEATICASDMGVDGSGRAHLLFIACDFDVEPTLYELWYAVSPPP